MVRRYSDFSWLAGELVAQYPGIIVPPVPEKQAVGRFSAEFIESRRRSLEKFLVRVLSHKELGQATVLVTFLQAAEDNLVQAKEEAKANRPKKSTISWLEGTVSTLANGRAELEKSAADIKSEEISQFVAQQDKVVAVVIKHAEGLSKKNNDVSHAYFDLAQSLKGLGEAESQQSLAQGLAQVSGATDSLSALLSTQAEAEIVKLVEPLQEYARMLASIRIAVSQRQERRNHYVQTLSEVEARKTAYRKVMGVPGKETQAKAKEQLVVNAEEACSQAQKEFELVSERLLTSFEAFKAQKGQDFKETLLQFVSMQIDFHRKAEQVWSDLLPKVEMMHVESVQWPEPPSAPSLQTPSANPFAPPSPPSTNPFAQPHSPTDRPVSSRSDFQEHSGDEEDELVGV